MTKVTKAVLACGGWSTRFLPTTKVIAKQLVPILDKPQILYIFKECLSAGINEFCIIHREGETSIQSFFAPDPILDKYLTDNNKTQYMDEFKSIMSQIKKLEFLPQTDKFPYGNGSPILVAKDFIGNDPFVYMYADDFMYEITPGSFLTQMMGTYDQYQPQAIFGSQEVPIQNISKLSSVKFKSNSEIPNLVETVIEKPDPANAPSNVCIFGRFILSPKIISTLENTDIVRGELWLTDAINNLAKTDVVMAEPTQSPTMWMTTGDPLNWLKANITVAMSDPEIGPEIKDFIQKIK